MRYAGAFRLKGGSTALPESSCHVFIVFTASILKLSPEWCENCRETIGDTSRLSDDWHVKSAWYRDVISGYCVPVAYVTFLRREARCTVSSCLPDQKQMLLPKAKDGKIRANWWLGTYLAYARFTKRPTRGPFFGF